MSVEARRAPGRIVAVYQAVGHLDARGRVKAHELARAELLSDGTVRLAGAALGIVRGWESHGIPYYGGPLKDGRVQIVKPTDGAIFLDAMYSESS
jgi:hypothetical protein